MKNMKFYVLVFILFFTSCNKYIDLAPQNSTFDEVFWRDANNIPKATAGGYALLRDALRENRSFFIFGDFAAGNFVEGDGDWNYYGFIKSGEFNFNLAPELENSLWNWTRFYAVINQSNLIIRKIADIPSEDFAGGEDEKNEWIAQARFLRAFANFYMQRVWGDILLIKQSYDDPQNVPPIARSSQEETLKFCIEDLKFVEEHLNDTGSLSYASKGAAQALMAHIYAWQHDYENAELYASEVINGAYSLESVDNYLNIWKGESSEVIFELPMLYSESGNEFSNDFFDSFLSDPFIRGKSAGSAWRIDADALDYFQEPEQRFEIMSNSQLLLKYSTINYYNPNSDSQYAVSNNLVLFRLADLYLLRAEALSKTGQEQLALDDLNVIRERAGLEEINVFGEELFFEIFAERRRELIGEGSTQFDLIRMEMFDKLDEYSGIYSQERISNQGYYWPLHMRVLLPQNELLTQNMWWKFN